MKRILILALAGGSVCAQGPPAAPVPPTSKAGVIVEPGPATTELLPELPPTPKGKTTLIGGTVSKLDRVRDAMTVQPYGGHRLTVMFDARTQVYREGLKVSQRELHNGDRVYVDTVQDGTTVFAKNIHVQTSHPSGESRGQILSYDRGRNQLTLNDSIAKSVTLQVTPNTRVMRDQQATTMDALVPGTLVTVTFRPSSNGPATAEEISVLASPGTAFAFAGQVTYLDMHSGLMVLVDPRDRKNYEIHFDPAHLQVTGELREGSDVTVTADFDGVRYVTTAVAVISPVQP